MKKTMYGEIPLILTIKIRKIYITCAYTLYLYIIEYVIILVFQNNDSIILYMFLYDFMILRTMHNLSHLIL